MYHNFHVKKKILATYNIRTESTATKFKTNKCTATPEKYHYLNTVCFSLSSFLSVNIYSCHRTAVFSVLQLVASLSGFQLSQH